MGGVATTKIYGNLRPEITIHQEVYNRIDREIDDEESLHKSLQKVVIRPPLGGLRVECIHQIYKDIGGRQDEKSGAHTDEKG